MQCGHGLLNDPDPRDSLDVVWNRIADVMLDAACTWREISDRVRAISEQANDWPDQHHDQQERDLQDHPPSGGK